MSIFAKSVIVTRTLSPFQSLLLDEKCNPLLSTVKLILFLKPTIALSLNIAFALSLNITFDEFLNVAFAVFAITILNVLASACSVLIVESVALLFLSSRDNGFPDNTSLLIGLVIGLSLIFGLSIKSGPNLTSV